MNELRQLKEKNRSNKNFDWIRLMPLNSGKKIFLDLYEGQPAPLLSTLDIKGLIVSKTNTSVSLHFLDPNFIPRGRLGESLKYSAFKPNAVSIVFRFTELNRCEIKNLKWCAVCKKEVFSLYKLLEKGVSMIDAGIDDDRFDKYKLQYRFVCKDEKANNLVDIWAQNVEIQEASVRRLT